jgi:hypothetical protein
VFVCQLCAKVWVAQKLWTVCNNNNFIEYRIVNACMIQIKASSNFHCFTPFSLMMAEYGQQHLGNIANKRGRPDKIL